MSIPEPRIPPRHGGALLPALAIAAGLGFAAYMIWGCATYAGLYRSLAEWQIAHFGGFLMGMTVIVPIMLVTCPLVGIGVVMLPDRPARAGSGGTWLWALVTVALLGGGIALVARARAFPSLDDPLVTIDVAKAGEVPPAAVHAKLVGRAAADKLIALRWRGKTSLHEDAYTPILPPAGAGPVRFVVKRATLDPAGPPQAAADDPEGVLKIDALPNDARAAFERGGVLLADEVHVLDPMGYDGLMDWVIAICATLAGLLCLVPLVLRAFR